MAKVLLNTFNGGLAEDSRTFATNQHTASANFDLFTDGHLMQPYIDQVAETTTSGTITDYRIKDVDSILFGGNTTLVALGEESAGSAKPQFFVKNSSTDVTVGWLAKAIGANVVVHNSLVVYKDFAYCLGDTGSSHNLQKYDSNVTVSTIGAITTANYTAVVPRPFVHPEDNVLYFAEGNIIAKYDGTIFNGAVLTLSSNKIVVSLTNYGVYLAIACRPKLGSGSSTVYLWDKSATSNRLTSSIDLGATQVNIIENIGNVLYIISTLSNVGAYSTVSSNRMSIKSYYGGQTNTLKTFTISSTFGTALNNLKVKWNDKLYFGFSNDTALFVFGRNKTGEFFCSHDKSFPSGTTTLRGINIVGNMFWTAFDTVAQANQFYRTIAQSESQAYTYTSTFTTTINQGMVIEDRYYLKQLEAISVAFTQGTLVSLKYSWDGGAFTTVIADSTSTGEANPQATTDTTAIPFGSGRELTITVESTGNAKIKEIAYRYSILETQL